MSDFVFDRGTDVASQTPRRPRATLGSDDAEEIFASINPKVLGRFIPYLKPHKAFVIGAQIAVLISAATAIAIPYMIGQAVNAAVGGGVISRRNDSGPGIPTAGGGVGGAAPPRRRICASATSVALCGGESARYLANPPATARSHRSRPSLPGGKTSVPILVSSFAAYSLNRLRAPRTSTWPLDSSSWSACSARPTRRCASPTGADEGPGCIEPVAPAADAAMS